MYLEFISAVTEDILSRGSISDRFLLAILYEPIEILNCLCLMVTYRYTDNHSTFSAWMTLSLSSERVLDRVIKRHIDMNRHQLNVVRI